MIENINEIWLPIENYEDYQVSNHGRVKSLNYNKTKQEQILKQVTTKYGYKQVGLCKNGTPKMLYVHRLVASAFIPNPNNYPFINHKDEVKTNNHVDNLEWCTAQYNNNYGTRNEKVSKALSGENCHLFGKFGKEHPMYGKLGKEHPNSKQIIQLTLDNEVVRTFDSTMDVERELGFNHAHISKCCKGRYKSSYGYKWAYA